MKAISAGIKDTSNIRPTPNGAYLADASIYSRVLNRSAATSQYSFDDHIADIAQSTMIDELNKVRYTGQKTFVSP